MLALRKFWLLILVVGSTVAFSSCGDDEPEIPNEEELITTVTLNLVDNAGNTVTLSFQDLDGDGGNAPTIIGGMLNANTTYTGSLELLNKSESPAESITEEIEEESDEHQFFFEVSNGLDLTTNYSDQDSNGNPVGLSTSIVAGTASQGTLKVTLRHEPNKTASGVKEGNIANAGGETDIEISFPITIQ